jgi:diguanylate cyclase (GGDEF)-like protein
VATPASLGGHTVHLVVFGTPVVVLAVVVGVQELRGRRRPAVEVDGAATGAHRPAAGITAWQWVAAGGTAVAGVTHAFVIREHFAESALYGTFFCFLMATQALLTVLLLRRPSTKVLERVGVVSVSVLCLWLLSRTSGLPVGPHPWHPETYGRLDILASGAELVTTVACAVLIIGRRRAAHRRGGAPSPVGSPLDHGFVAVPTGPWGLVMQAVRWLPRGRPLPESVWKRRHGGIVRFALLQAVGVGLFGYLRGFAVPLCLVDVALVAFPALLACSVHSSRRVRTISATTSLMLASVSIVDLAGGVTEAHFHFFVMVGVVALYQDWTAFGACFFITVADHAVMGSLLPRDVYGTPAERRDPILWAFIHGAFILALAFTQVLAWRNNEAESLSDPLTRLPNRTAFTERLERAVSDHRQPTAVLFVDLDLFKNINDSYGHAVGDRALQAAAERMAGCIRRTDLLARLGGDEFAVVVEGPEAFGPALAVRIHESLQAPEVIDKVPVFVRASIGVAATGQAHPRSGHDLLRCADLAMYMAKSSGKNTVVVYDAHMDQAVTERAELAAALRPALLHGEFTVDYQPVVLGSDGALVGVEALVRWHHPPVGSIGPATFIPLAEETGDINGIGLWVLQAAASQVVQWNTSRPAGPRLTVAVNLSPVQLGEADFVDSVLAVLQVTGLDPALLILEVTEGLRLHDWQSSCERLNQLRALGVRVAIDDFGTGYSSLSYLADLPADIVKIDQSFIRNLFEKAGALALVTAVMELAKSLDLDVIAEGVETAQQQAALSGLGCLHSQGFLHSEPLSAPAFTALLAAEAVAPADVSSADLARASRRVALTPSQPV